MQPVAPDTSNYNTLQRDECGCQTWRKTTCGRRPTDSRKQRENKWTKRHTYIYRETVGLPCTVYHLWGEGTGQEWHPSDTMCSGVLHTVTETIIQAAAHVFQLKCSALRHKTHHLMYSNQWVNEWHIHACTSIEQVTDTHLHMYWTCDRHTLAQVLNMWQTHTCTSTEHVTDTCLHTYWTCDSHTLAHILNMWQTHTCTSTEQVTRTCLHMYWTGHRHPLEQVLNKWHPHTCTSIKQVTDTHLHKYWTSDRHTLAQGLSKWSTHLHKFPLPAKSCYHYCCGKTKVFLMRTFTHRATVGKNIWDGFFRMSCPGNDVQQVWYNRCILKVMRTHIS